MILAKLFETQRVLDARIEKEHPRVEGEDRLGKKILALQVELGECANEWRGFKFWSTNQTPSIGFYYTENGTEYKNPLLEEYVDCLHFILSIGLECGFDKQELNHIHEHNFSVYKERTILIQFEWIFLTISDFTSENDLSSYEELFLYFMGLGIHLGFEIEQIEQAYYDKNVINHTRQDTGY